MVETNKRNVTFCAPGAVAAVDLEIWGDAALTPLQDNKVVGFRHAYAHAGKLIRVQGSESAVFLKPHEIPPAALEELENWLKTVDMAQMTPYKAEPIVTSFREFAITAEHPYGTTKRFDAPVLQVRSNFIGAKCSVQAHI